MLYRPFEELNISFEALDPGRAVLPTIAASVISPVAKVTTSETTAFVRKYAESIASPTSKRTVRQKSGRPAPSVLQGGNHSFSDDLFQRCTQHD